MPDTFTTNLNLTKPEVGGSTDTWGTKLNGDLDAVDALFATGPVLLLAKGGTGAATAAAARTNLGLGSMATQADSAVAITGGSAIFTSASRVDSATPAWRLKETDATATNQSWSLAANGGSFYLRLAADDFSSDAPVITVTRDGLTPLAVNIQATLQVLGNDVWHEGNQGDGSGADADLLDGEEGSFYQNASNLNSGLIPSARVAAEAVTQHQGVLAITENQITNGTVFPRLGSAETVTGQWSFTAIPRGTGAGGFLFHAAAANTGGTVHVATSAASGTPAAGDIWIQYV